MTATIVRGPNADLMPQLVTTADDHRRAWHAVATNTERSISLTLLALEDQVLGFFRAEDERPRRWRRLPANLGHLLDQAVGAAEHSIAADELTLAQARKHAHGGRR